jgi:hypothetical protein
LRGLQQEGRRGEDITAVYALLAQGRNEGQAMSLDPNAKPADAVHVNHYCCVDNCGIWGAFGFARSKSEESQWWCEEHYPHWENKREIER